MYQHKNGSWSLELHGICYREMAELGKMLVELGTTGEYNGEGYDLDTLNVEFDASTGELVFTDDYLGLDKE